MCLFFDQTENNLILQEFTKRENRKRVRQLRKVAAYNGQILVLKLMTLKIKNSTIQIAVASCTILMTSSVNLLHPLLRPLLRHLFHHLP